MTTTRCEHCNGKGEVPTGHASLTGQLVYGPCDDCLGYGVLYDSGIELYLPEGWEDMEWDEIEAALDARDDIFRDLDALHAFTAAVEGDDDTAFEASLDRIATGFPPY